MFLCYKHILHDNFLAVNTFCMIFFKLQKNKGDLCRMCLVDKIRLLANKKGISLPVLETELGFGNGTISRWKTSSPSTEKLKKVAQYFDVSLDYLAGNDSSDYGNIGNMYLSIAKEAQEQGIDPEDIRDMIQIIKKARERK